MLKEVAEKNGDANGKEDFGEIHEMYSQAVKGFQVRTKPVVEEKMEVEPNAAKSPQELIAENAHLREEIRRNHASAAAAAEAAAAVNFGRFRRMRGRRAGP